MGTEPQRIVHARRPPGYGVDAFKAIFKTEFNIMKQYIKASLDLVSSELDEPQGFYADLIPNTIRLIANLWDRIKDIDPDDPRLIPDDPRREADSKKAHEEQTHRFNLYIGYITTFITRKRDVEKLQSLKLALQDLDEYITHT